MSTVHTPPIDLYAETDEREEWADQRAREAQRITPRDNGDRDEDAVVAGEHRLEQVLGW